MSILDDIVQIRDRIPSLPRQMAVSATLLEQLEKRLQPVQGGTLMGIPIRPCKDLPDGCGILMNTDGTYALILPEVTEEPEMER